MDGDGEDREEETTVRLRRNSDITEDFVRGFNRYCLRREEDDHDLEFLCKDGTVSFYQSILASHSDFAKGLLGRFQSVEFSIGDWQYGEMFLLDRRKTNEVLSISVPDLTAKEVRFMLDLLYQGSVSLSGTEDATALRDVWRMFRIDSVRLDSLDVISEVDLLKTSSKSVKNSSVQNHFIKLQSIKKEIVEENEEYLSFRTGLEVECELCRETFQQEDDLMRHVDYIHQTNKSMYDRIKFKRAKENTDGGSNSKGKGKGKGKKSFETRPVRKEQLQTRSVTPTVVDSNSNSMESEPPGIEDDIHISDNEISFKTSFEEQREREEDEKSKTSSASNTETDVKRVTLEKRKKSPTEEGPVVKKLRTDAKSDDNSTEDEGGGAEPEETWEDIVCLYCDQSIAMQRDRPGQNKKKYQSHLLTHFSATQYSDITEGLRGYECTYQGCGYTAGHKNHFLQHVAFKHDEWYKRINRRIEEALRDPSIAEELEDLSAIKEAFVTDSRIMPHSGGSKPLWVDGTVLGREPESEKPEDDSPPRGPHAPSEGCISGNNPQQNEKEPEEHKKKTKDAPLLQCHFCQKIMRTDPENIVKNRNSYQIHLVESHFEATMYGDLPEAETYKCPVTDCDFPSTELKSRLRIHLAINHQEFYPRVQKRIRELKMIEQIDKEYQKLNDVLRFFREDPRVQDDLVPDDRNEEDVEHVKRKKDMPEIKVEISEEFSQFLKTGKIKTEPEDTGNKEESGKIPAQKLDDPLGKGLSPEPEKKKKKKDKKAKKVKSGKKKSKKEIKTKHLRKQQEKEEEVTIKIEDEDDYSSASSSKNDQEKEKSDTDKQVNDTEIIKLHEEIVNSQDSSPAVLLDDDKTEAPKKAEDKGKHSLAENEITLDDEDDVMEISTGDADNASDKGSEPEILLDEKEKPSEDSRINETNIRDEKKEKDGETQLKTQNEDKEVAEEPKKPSLEYSCRGCKMEFDKRPDVIIHIITIHMVDRFGALPDLVEGKFHCPHEGCEYTSSKTKGLLAHLTLKHEAVKITEVTDLIVHNELEIVPEIVHAGQPAAENVEATTSEDNEKKVEVVEKVEEEVVKKETIEEPLQVSLTNEDHADISWKCRTCSKSFSSEDLVRQHVLMFHLMDRFDKSAPKDLKIYSCDRCHKYSTTSRVSFIKHLGMVHQAVSDHVFSEHIEQCRTLLLDIDVIKCSCDKKFDKEKQLRHHIIFTHLKNKFRHIPKGVTSYRCKDYHPGCLFVGDSRVTLIKHSVSVHNSVTEEEFSTFMSPPVSASKDVIAVDDSSSIESIDNDDSSIGFNDSVSQAANPQPSVGTVTQTIIDIPDKIRMGGEPFENNSCHKCPICFKIVAQRSNFEDHLQTHAIQNDPVFLSHDGNFVTSFGQIYCHLSVHHAEKSARVECLCCETVFSGSNALETFNQLRDHCVGSSRKTHQQKSLNFMEDLKNNLHAKFRYSCQTCSMYFLYSDDLKSHGVTFNSRCHQMNHGARIDPVFTCHLCHVNKPSSVFGQHLQGIQHQHEIGREAGEKKEKYGLSYKQTFYSCGACKLASSYDNILGHVSGSSGCSVMMCGACDTDIGDQPQGHVMSDKHVRSVANFSDSDLHTKHVLRFKYGCDSCSFYFTTGNDLVNHSNCPKMKYRCVPCNVSCKSAEFPLHFKSKSHVERISSLKMSGHSQDDVGTVTLDSDITSSIPDNGVRALTGKPRTIPERPASPPDDSIIELEVTPSEPSVMEVIQPPVPRKNGAMVTNSSSMLMRPPVAVAGPSGIRPKVRPNPQQRPFSIQQQQQQLQHQSLKKFMYFCEACKKKFSDPQKFQSHSAWHDSAQCPGQGKKTVKMICQVCSWSVSDISVSGAVTKHLFSNRHTINVARKMSDTV